MSKWADEQRRQRRQSFSQNEWAQFQKLAREEEESDEDDDE